jgi:exo-beta-1,3-glucanase (GH17 family)
MRTLGFFLILAALAIYPARVVVVPPSTVRIVNVDGQPFSGVQISERWQGWSADPVVLTDTVFTDKNGYAYFEGRVVSASLTERALKCINKIRRYGTHADCRSNYTITVIQDRFKPF